MRHMLSLLMIAGLCCVASPASAASLTTNVGHRHAGARIPAPAMASDLVMDEVNTCDCTCRPGDYNENEPDCYDGYYDYTNGGCNSTGWTELDWPQDQVHCAVRACGTSGTFYYGYYSYRDTDWFRASTHETGATSETVNAQFAPLVLLIYADSGMISCDNYTYTYSYGTACIPSTCTAYIQAGSSFWPWVGPQVFGYGVPCGSRYLLDVSNVGPCQIVPTQSTTWGKVKSVFR